MNDWISVKDQMPAKGANIKIKAFNNETKEFIEGDAVFEIMDVDERTEAWRWIIKSGYKTTIRPMYWMLKEKVEEGP